MRNRQATIATANATYPNVITVTPIGRSELPR